MAASGRNEPRGLPRHLGNESLYRPPAVSRREWKYVLVRLGSIICPAPLSLQPGQKNAPTWIITSVLSEPMFLLIRVVEERGGVQYESACGYGGASHVKRNSVSFIRDLVELLRGNIHLTLPALMLLVAMLYRH